MLQKFWKRMKREEGFTLLEVLVVIAILGIIAALITPKFMSVMQESRLNTAKAGAKQIQTGLERYTFNSNGYPAQAGLTNYLQLTQAIGNAANLPNPSGNNAPAGAAISFLHYSAPGVVAATNAYELVLHVENANADNDACLLVTPNNITTGVQGTDANGDPSCD